MPDPARPDPSRTAEPSTPLEPSRACVYTVLVGGYERLTAQPTAADSGIRFLCFTDDVAALAPQAEGSGWQLREVPRLLAHDARRSARAVKLLPHEHLAEFDTSLYIDNSVRLDADPGRVLAALLPEAGDDVGLLRHSFRRSLLDEFLAVVDAGRDDATRVYEQLQVYATTTPELLDRSPWWTGVLARRHLRPAVVDFGRRWLAQVLRYSVRDQLSARAAACESGVSVRELAEPNHRTWFHAWPVSSGRRLDVDVETSAASLVPVIARARKAEEVLAWTQERQLEHANTLVLARGAVDALARQLDRATTERDGLQARLDAVVGSASWRVTAPVRSLRERARGGPAAPRVPGASGPASSSPTSSSRDAGGDVLATFERRMAAEYERALAGLPTRTPLSFRHKVWVRRAVDRRPVLRTLVDKVEVRGYVADRVGEHYLPALYGVHDDAADLGPGGQPERFALRSSHASGGVVLAWDGPVGDMTEMSPWWRAAFPAGELPWDTVRARLGTVLGLDYGLERLEWAYVGLPRRIVVEELMRGPDGGPPEEYLFYVFDGVPRLCNVVQGRYVNVTQAFRTLDFEPVRSGAAATAPAEPPERPAEWTELVELATTLGQGLDMVRVDLFRTDRGPRVGELTVYPGAGTGMFDPPVDDLVRGALWTLPPLGTLRG